MKIYFLQIFILIYAHSFAQNSDSWLLKSLEYKGIAIEDDDWQIWGTSPIADNEGKIHLFVARWPVETGHEGWYTDSEIAHYIGNDPKGPFYYHNTILRGTKKNTWDKFAPHNPTIHKVDSIYALFYIANTGKDQRPRNQKIGLVTSKSLYGPWEKAGENGLILSPPEDSTYYNYNSSNGVVNPAFLKVSDSKYFLYFKSNDMRKLNQWRPKMGLAVSERLEGPYTQLPFPITNNKSIIEDGYAFKFGEKIYLITTDNHGMIERGGGIIWESDDGLEFSNPKLAFKKLPYYFNNILPSSSNMTKGEVGNKFERPQILLINGSPSYLYVASGTNVNGGKGSVSYIFKIREEFIRQ